MAETRLSSGSEPLVDKGAKYWMRKEFVAKDLEMLLAKKLMWDELFPHQISDAKSFKYLDDSSYSHSTDPKKLYPADWKIGAEFPYVTVTAPSLKADVLASQAIAFQVNPDIIFTDAKYDPLQRTKERVAYWFAEKINKDTMDAVITTSSGKWTTDSNNVTADSGMVDIMSHVASNFGTHDTTGVLAGDLDSTYYWDEADANPVVDIMDLKTVFNSQSGYPYKATDVYMRDEELNLLTKYLIDIDASWQLSPFGGVTTPLIAGINFHSVGDEAGFPNSNGDGWILMLDRNNPAITIYEGFYPNYPRTKKFNYDVYTDNETKITHYHFWNLRKAKLFLPRAVAVLKVRD